MTLGTRLSTTGVVLLGLLWALPAATPSAQSATTSAPRFRWERPITATGAGPQRLAIDLPLLSNATPFTTRAMGDAGLSDLRLFDAANHEVPYLLVRPSTAQATWLRAGVLPIAATKESSGCEADFGASVTVDRIRVSGLPSPFLKRVVVEGSGDRQHWTMLAAEGTLFDLPDEHLQQLELPFAPGDYRYVRLTWDDTNSGRVPMPGAVLARQNRLARPAPASSATVAIERRPSEPRRSRYAIRLPAPHLPLAALVLDVDGGHVLREASVTESRLEASEAIPARLGFATLRRVVVGGLAASDLRIPIEAPSEAQLDLTIDDGDNPPLAITRVTAEFAELPWIYFESDGSPLVARYGSHTREAPRYDLEAVRDTLKIESAPEAHWGEARALVAAGTDGPEGPLPLEGGSIDATLFRHVRDVPGGPAGLVVLPLDTAALSQSRGPDAGFADVRLITGDGRQVPYLLERRDEPLVLTLTIERATSSVVDRYMSAGRPDGRPFTVYRVHLPFVSMPRGQLVLATDARVFDRSVTIGIEHSGDRNARDPYLGSVVTSRWLHADRQQPAPKLVLPLNTISAADLLVVIDEGDNQPLALSAPQLLLPSYRLRFYRNSDAPIRLAYGRDDLAAPRYDLALLAPQVLGVAATEVAPLAAETAASHALPSALTSPWLFWSVLGVAVIVLLGFVVRLLAAGEAR